MSSDTAENDQPQSAYFLVAGDDTPVTHTLSVLVDNEPGVLARVIGLFSGRGYNICLLYTSPSPRDQRGSRMPSSA